MGYTRKMSCPACGNKAGLYQRLHEKSEEQKRIVEEKARKERAAAEAKLQKAMKKVGSVKAQADVLVRSFFGDNPGIIRIHDISHGPTLTIPLRGHDWHGDLQFEAAMDICSNCGTYYAAEITQHGSHQKKFF